MKPLFVRRLLSVLSLALVLLLAERSHAEDPPELPQPIEAAARTHLKAGGAAYDRGRAASDGDARQAAFREAIQEYMKGLAVESKYHYTFYWNLGHAHRQLGEFTRADYWYKKFIEVAPSRYDVYKSAADDFQRAMKAEIDKANTLAKPIEHQEKPDDPVTADLTSKDNASTTPTRDRPAWYSDRVGWGLAGGGAIGLLVGGGFLLNSASLYDQAKDEDRQSVANDLNARGDRRALIGAITGGVGAVVLVTGVIKLARTDGVTSPSSAIQVTVGPAWLTIQGGF
jgi:tetratricopeptide (TPR) repeat protein